MDDLVRFLRHQNTQDNHAFAYVIDHFGPEALLDSHLPMLDLIDMLAQEWQSMDPADDRHPGLSYALAVLVRSYYEHPDYQQKWNTYPPGPEPLRESGPR